MDTSGKIIGDPKNAIVKLVMFLQNDSFSADPQVWYTTTGNNVVYASMLGWPSNESFVTLQSVRATSESKFEILGQNGKYLEFNQDENYLHIYMPSYFKLIKACATCQIASVIKMTNVLPHSDILSNEVKVQLQ